MNLDLILAYSPVLLAALFVASALSIQGSFIIEKRQSSWILAVSQICISGHLLSKIFLTHEHGYLELIFSIAFYFIGLFSVKRFSLSDSSLLCLFIFFMAINYQLIAIFPHLDSHLASSLFGDIATLTNSSAYQLMGMAALYLTFHFFLAKIRLKSLLEKSYYRSRPTKIESLSIFNFFAHLFLIYSLFELGFLFVLGFLLLPTQLLKGMAPSFTKLSLFNLVISLLAAAGGLLLSLSWTRLSTMPTQISLLVIMALLILGGRKAYNFISART